MTNISKDIIPFSEMKKHLSKIAEEVNHFKKEKIITKNGRSFFVLIDPEQLDYYHDLERNLILSNLLNEAQKGIFDLEKGNLHSLTELKSKYNVE